MKYQRNPGWFMSFFLCTQLIFISGCSESGSRDSTEDDEADQAGVEKDAGTDGAAQGDSGTDADTDSVPYAVVDTGQNQCYDSSKQIQCPEDGQAFSGQDAQHHGLQPSYQDNGDGTVTDLNTGLMWQKAYATEKMSYQDALDEADSFDLAGHDDWRLPDIKELYSLIVFTGTDPDPMASSTSGLEPFIDDAFDFRYGDVGSGERVIDAQYATSTEYGSTTMGGNFTVFGVNFADGRIKGYPGDRPMFEVKYVRGNPHYGKNDFKDNGDGTITDTATGLMWDKNDSAQGLLWEDALSWVKQKNDENHLGYSDWRLPDVKELQSIVNYARSPDITGSAAIDPVFECTPITNEGGQTDYAHYWSSTTHLSANGGATRGSYVCFGRCLGYWQNAWQDVHGAGAQRSDPKTGDPDDYPTGLGPQGDAIRILNFVRCVRNSN